MVATFVGMLIALNAHAAPRAARCKELARPTEFDAAAAMRALYCKYNPLQKGTLIPVALTPAWEIADAQVLATPLFAAIYREGETLRGVVAIQRQQLEDGAPVETHATVADISVHVFRFDGAHWLFEKGARAAASAGAHGYAPGARLVRIGEDAYGLLFEGGDIHQGYTEDYAFLVPLSDARVREIGPIFDTGQSNRGACSPKPRDGLGPCWEYEGRFQVVRRPSATYDLLRIAYEGTDDTGNPKNEAVCYQRDGDAYVRAQVADCAALPARTDAEVFGAGWELLREQPIPSIPRKLLR